MFHRDWQAVRPYGFDTNLAVRVLGGYATRLSPQLDRYTFEDPDAERQDALDYIKTISGDVPLRYPPLRDTTTYSDIAGWQEPAIAAPFLVVQVDWQGDGTDIGYYSEADLATSQYQLHGRVTNVGTITRAFGVDSSIQRSQVTLELEDIDRVFATRVRNNDYLSARFAFYIGSPAVKPRSYYAIGARYRVLDVGELAETTVSLTLIDATEDICGASIKPPEVGELGDFNVRPSGVNLGIDSANWTGISDRRSIDKLQRSAPTQNQDTSRPIPVPFGRAIFRPAYAWAREPAYREYTSDRLNPQAVIVVGASKNPAWKRTGWYGECFGKPAGGVEPIIWGGTPGLEKSMFLATKQKASPYAIVPDSTTGLVAWWQISERSNRFEPATADPWYILTLYVLYYGSSSSVAERTRHALSRLRIAIAANNVWVDLQGFGAAGQGATATFDTANSPLFGDTPVDVVEYLARYHSGYGVSALQGPDRVIEGTDDARTAASTREPVGGIIDGEADGTEVVSRLCATYGLDVGVTGRGRLILRPQDTTRDDKYLRIPTARTFTDGEHILEGTWQEFAPKGSDRWGFGTVFKFRGAGPLISDLPEFANDYGFTPLAATYGQEIEKAVEISWRRQSNEDAGITRGSWSYPYMTPRYGARFRVPCTLVLGLEPGDFCYVTHYAGANADGTKGWDRRICRIDGIAIDWPPREAEVTVIDWLTDYQALPWVLDDQGFWTVDKPILVADYADMTASSADVVFSGIVYPSTDWVGCEFRISRAYNLHPYPASDFTTYRPNEAQCVSAIIESVNEGTRTITLDRTYGETYRTRAWRVNRTHTVPPADPYKYPNGDELYGRLCDTEAAASDGSIGAFSNSDPGYRLR